ncbi:MAG: molybdopterin-dependent oxidoreductase [Burkholderiaceae bacterium]|nr:molybdopterin-dependent oxidoreductase [Microbacteriaceae bacterium]
MHALLHGTRRSLATPSRNPRMAVVIGRLLGIAFIVCFLTGLYSHFLQDPLPWMVFPTRPIWLYQVSQGIHITAGIACFPLILAKLYIVFPDLFQSPPVRSFTHFLERASIALFVAASLVQITIGLLNTFQFYSLFPFAFRQTHYALSFVIIGSLAIHIAVKLDIISRHWRKRDSAPRVPRTLTVASSSEAASDQAASPQAADVAGSGTRGLTGRVFAWIDSAPQPEPRASRRGFLVTVAIAVGTVVTLTAGQSFRILDGTNLFAPRKKDIGPNAVPVNRTARAAKVLESAVDPAWVLTVSNGTTARVYTYDDLRAMQQYDVELPISCVEGWSQMASWRGPRLRDLVDSVGGDPGARITATSLEQGSIYAVMDMGPEFVRDELTLVALQLNGAPLDIDHGYPARMIAPARPGVLQTKWLSSIEVVA